MPHQKRQSFRLVFPRSYHPDIFYNNKSYAVFDASEFGIKFYHANDQFTLDGEISFSIRFPDGDSYELKGKIIRCDSHFICLDLLTHLPLSKIRSEHLHLIKNFTEYKQSV